MVISVMSDRLLGELTNKGETNGNHYGTAGDDIRFGTAVADTLNGRGRDYWLIRGGMGNDILNGGAGIDIADYSNRSLHGQTYIGATAGGTVNLNLIGAQNTGGNRGPFKRPGHRLPSLVFPPVSPLYFSSYEYSKSWW